MTRRNPAAGQRPATRPFDQQQLAQEGEIADRVQRVMDAIRDFDQDTVKATIWHKQGSATGSWQWCDDASLPPDMPAIMADMRERFGAGDYEIRVTALGRIRGNILFSIAKEKTSTLAAAPPAPAPATMGTAEILGLIMTQQSEARRDQQEAANRQMQLIGTLATAIVPALLSRPAAPAGTSAADLAALVTALRPAGDAGNFAETIKAMAAMKELLGPGEGAGGDGGGGGFDPDDLVASGARLVGPAMKALGDYVARMRPAGAEGSGGNANGAQVPPGTGGQLALTADPSAPPPAVSRFRVIELVKVDLNYFFRRGHDPQKAADMVYDIIEANQVTEAEIDELAAHFALSPTGLDDLAREGIDLRERPQWAAEFFGALHAIHTAAEDDSDGGDGGAPNP